MYLKQARPQPRFRQRLAFAAVYAVVLSLTCASALALRWSAPAASPLASKEPASARQSEGLPSTPVRVSAGIMSGQVRSRVDPEYPEAAKAAGVSGPVVLHAIIGKNGSIQSLQVLSGPPQLQASAIEAVQQWVYKPYLLNGLPVDVETTITVNYMLAN